MEISNGLAVIVLYSLIVSSGFKSVNVFGKIKQHLNIV